MSTSSNVRITATIEAPIPEEPFGFAAAAAVVADGAGVGG
jgi:hypothetical protein